MKKYIEVNNSDELILIDNKTKRAKYSVIYYDNDIIMKNIKEKYKNFFSIKEIDINTLACISSLDNFKFTHFFASLLFFIKTNSIIFSINNLIIIYYFLIIYFVIHKVS